MHHSFKPLPRLAAAARSEHPFRKLLLLLLVTAFLLTGGAGLPIAVKAEETPAPSVPGPSSAPTAPSENVIPTVLPPSITVQLVSPAATQPAPSVTVPIPGTTEAPSEAPSSGAESQPSASQSEAETPAPAEIITVPSAPAPSVVETPEALAEKQWSKHFELKRDRLSILLPYDDVILTDKGPSIDPRYLNPLMARNVNERMLGQLLYAPMHTIMNGKLLGLLETWTFTPDGKEAHLYLRKGLTWQDGQPITSRDILFSLLMMMKDGIYHPLTYTVREITGYKDLIRDPAFNVTDETLNSPPFYLSKGISTENDYELLVHFERDSRPFFYDFLALPVLPAHMWWKKAPRFWTPEEAKAALRVGTGPYALDLSEDFAGDLEFYAENGSGTQAASIPNLSVRLVPEARLVELLLKNHADLAMIHHLDRSDERELKAAGYTLKTVPGDELLALYVHVTETNPAFKSDEVRQALDLVLTAEKEEKMQDGLTYLPVGQSSLSPFTPLAPESLTEESEDSEERLEDRHNMAIELLLKAGWYTDETPQDKLAEFHNQYPETDLKLFPAVSLAYPVSDKTLEELALRYTDQLKKLGIPVHLVGLNDLTADGPSDVLSNIDLLLRRHSRWAVKTEDYCKPLYIPALIFASRDLQNFTPSFPLPFANAAYWVLRRH